MEIRRLLNIFKPPAPCRTTTNYLTLIQTDYSCSTLHFATSMLSFNSINMVLSEIYCLRIGAWNLGNYDRQADRPGHGVILPVSIRDCSTNTISPVSDNLQNISERLGDFSKNFRITPRFSHGSNTNPTTMIIIIFIISLFCNV